MVRLEQETKTEPTLSKLHERGKVTGVKNTDGKIEVFSDKLDKETETFLKKLAFDVGDIAFASKLDMHNKIRDYLARKLIPILDERDMYKDQVNRRFLQS